MISVELDKVNPSTIASNLGRRRDLMSSEIRRIEKHIGSGVVIVNYPQAIESFSVLKDELKFVESLIRTFQSRIPFDIF